MNARKQCPSQQRSHRQGTATVEFALVLPLMVLLFLGAIEIGRVVMVQHAMQEAAQAGCRVYMIGDQTQADAREVIDQSMQESNISNYKITFDPSLKSAITQSLQPVTVTITVPYDSVAWTGGMFMRGKTMASSAVMPADGAGGSK